MKIIYLVIISISLLFVVLSTFDAEAKKESSLIQYVAQKSQQSLKPCTRRNQQNCQRRKTRRSAPASTLQRQPTGTTQSHRSATQQGTHAQTGTYSAGELRGGGCTHVNNIVETKVKLTDNGMDFGGQAFVINAPTTSGALWWRLSCGEMTADLEGYLHLDGVDGLCSRIRMDFYTHGHMLMTTRYSNQQCSQDNRHHAWPVDVNLESKPNHFSSDKLNEVKISLERLDALGVWTSLRSEKFVLPDLHGQVIIKEDGFDFGGKTFLGNAPTTKGDVTFSWSGGKVTPRVTGTLYMNNAAGACARMKVEYYAIDGNHFSHDWVKSQYGGKVCAINGNTLHAWSVDLGPYGHENLDRIVVAIETLATDGKWSKVGSDSASYSDILLSLNN